MSNIQYTIRNVPEEVDEALRLRAKKNKQSFNTTVLDTLSRNTNTNKKKVKTDLDWFYGSGDIGKEELEAFAAQRVVDTESWVE